MRFDALPAHFFDTRTNAIQKNDFLYDSVIFLPKHFRNRMEPRQISQNSLVQLFKDAYDSEGIRFCFLLGAGASVSSSIPTGATLAKTWYEDIATMLTEAELQQWITDKKINPDKLAESYTAIYAQRFVSNYTAGYEALQKLMSKADPGIGYLILAKILAETRHSFVITTNFDYLVEDALFMVTNKRPMICGHEALANFIHAQSSRPTIVKVHRDLMLEPFNHTSNTSTLNEAWIKTLRPIVKDFHLVVIGYGGNDGSLMDYLKELPEENRQPIYWCCREPNNLSSKTKSLLTKKDYIVPIRGFDELMYAFNNISSFKDFIHDFKDDESSALIKNAREKTLSYRKKIDELAKQTDEKIKAGQQPDPGLQAILPDWWVDFQSKINQTDDVNEQEKLYLEGLKKLPDSAPLLENYALFLKNIRKDYDQAESFYKKALESDPNDADYLGNYANFLCDIRKDYDQAESFYKKALESDPNGADYLGNYANFLCDIRKDYDQAESFYKKALESDPNGADYLGNYANFLCDIRKDYDQAESFYKKALESDPNHANHLGNYAGFLLGLGRIEEGDQYLSQTFHAINDSQQALFLELWFYTLAHFPDRADEAREHIYDLLNKGIRSIGWDFSANITRAQMNGCPYVDELQDLAKKITSE